MANCERIQEVGAYYDGELSPAEQLLFEAHLAECAACAHELEVLHGLSRLLSNVRLPETPREVVERLHQRVAVIPARAVMRFAEVLTAAAAVVIALCAAWLWQAGESTASGVAALPAWAIVATVPRAESETLPSDQQVAEWMVKDLSSENAND